MAGLLAAENISRTAQFEIESCDAESGAEIGEFADGG